MSEIRRGALEPSVAEHGVNGYTSAAVGGFGEDYSHQVAHGEEVSAAPKTAGDQSQVEVAVREALARMHVDAADLRVRVNDGTATLLGTVRSLEEKHALGAEARRVLGVTHVRNKLQVQAASPR